METQASAPDFVRVTAASHPTALAHPQGNARATLAALATHADSQVLVFGELSLTGYSCGDLFSQDQLLADAQRALASLVEGTRDSFQVVIVGLPVRCGGALYNAAAVIQQGRLLGLVPKQFLPNYQEFYEARWFTPADGSEPSCIGLEALGEVPFGTDLLFEAGSLVIGVEICEDLWMPVPPSSLQAMAGANLLVNLSASNELVGKADWRETLVRSQSGRCLAAYAYASAGPTESTTDLVFGGDCLIAENGTVLDRSQRVGDGGKSFLERTSATADIDLQKLMHDRQITVTWQQAAKRQPLRHYRRVPAHITVASNGSRRRISGTPFVPHTDSELHARCSEIFGIQCAALAKRVSRLPENLQLHIGISGGLDSTLALLVAVKTCQQQQWSPQRVWGITMPGFGTTPRTLAAAHTLMKELGITAEEIDIRQLCLDTFRGLGHRPFGLDLTGLSVEQSVERLAAVPEDQLEDLTFENVQARVRTMLLMSRGFVLGTGDLSEQALGWSTYNGDHMSMYNVNTSIPKTLVRFLVRYVAEYEFPAGPVRDCLLGIADTPISPELLPVGASGQIEQHTEREIGAYELHDFFLYHLLRFGASPPRILELAGLAEFSQDYSAEEIRQTLRTFLKRFFANQFKRSCVPDGPKVGSVSLSPRGDWRMPSDAEATAWLDSMED